MVVAPGWRETRPLENDQHTPVTAFYLLLVYLTSLSSIFTLVQRYRTLTRVSKAQRVGHELPASVGVW